MGLKVKTKGNHQTKHDQKRWRHPQLLAV